MKIMIALLLSLASMVATAGETIEFKVTYHLGDFNVKPKIELRSDNVRVDFRSKDRIVFKVGSIKIDTHSNDWLVNENENIDIDLTSIYNYKAN